MLEFNPDDVRALLCCPVQRLPCVYCADPFCLVYCNITLQRITVEQALEHPYLENLHEPEEELNCPNQFDFSFENGTHMVVWVRVLVRVRVPIWTLYGPDPNPKFKPLTLILTLITLHPTPLTLTLTPLHPYPPRRKNNVLCSVLFCHPLRTGELKKPQLRSLIFEDCCHFHPELKSTPPSMKTSGRRLVSMPRR
jgi:hypothetical protein